MRYLWIFPLNKSHQFLIKKAKQIANYIIEFRKKPENKSARFQHKAQKNVSEPNRATNWRIGQQN